MEDEHEKPLTNNMLINMTAGATSGVVENCLFYPLDTVKTRMQDIREGGAKPTLLNTMTSMVKNEGFTSLFKGFITQASGSAPAHAVYFGSYEMSKQYLSKYIDGGAKYALAGAVATIAFDGIMIPTETIKQRLQMENSPYKSFTDCATKIFKEEGIRGFYRSYGTQLLIGIPFQSIHFMTYEFVSDKLNPKREYSPIKHIIAGGVAGGLAALITTPLDVCKTVLNVQQQKNTVVGVSNAVKTVYKTAGLPGFFRGASARMLLVIPSTAACWATYETMKKLLNYFTN